VSLPGVRALSRPVRRPVVLYRFGRLSMPLGGLFAVPAAVGVATGDMEFALRCTAMLALCLAVGWGLGRIRAPDDLRAAEGLVVVAALFVAAAALMTWPFMAAGLAPLDAFFEAVSGITTTGLSTAGTVEQRPAAFLIARAWTQWYGGLAIVALAFAFSVGPGPAARRLATVEGQPDDLAATTRLWARRAMVIFAVLTLAGMAIVLPFGLPLVDGVAHVLAGISTGGFSSRDGGIAALGGWPVQTALLLLGLAGAISFTLYDRGWRRGWRGAAGDVELRALLAVAALSTVLLAGAMLLAGRPAAEVATAAPLLALSAQTTTGFAPAAVSDLDAAGKLVLIATMFIGGDAGSTAGGIKIVRLLLMLRLMQVVLLRATLPRGAVLEVRAGGRRVEAEDVQAALGVVLLYAAVVLLAWFAFLLAGAPALDSLFDVVSALSTTGLSTGVTGPGLSPWLKGLLCAVMLMGRLEIVALLVLVYPGSWLQYGRGAT
jgi:trk system potassium uptake protein TrkH